MDTGAFIALQDRSDQFHSPAVACYQDLFERMVPLLTTNFVLNETYTWLQRSPGFGHPAASRFGEWFREVSSSAMLESDAAQRGKGRYSLAEVPGQRRPFSLLYASPEVEAEAWRLFAQYGPSGATYTDCVSFAVMGMLGLEQAFAFDEHFSAAGFERVPGV